MLSEVLRSCRQASGKSIVQVCKEMEISKQYLMDLETGRASPNEQRIKKFSEVLNAPFCSLLEEKIKEKGYITIPCKKEIQVKFAAQLLVVWGDLTEEQLLKLKEVLVDV